MTDLGVAEDDGIIEGSLNYSLDLTPVMEPFNNSVTEMTRN